MCLQEVFANFLTVGVIMLLFLRKGFFQHSGAYDLNLRSLVKMCYMYLECEEFSLKSSR